MRRGVRPDAAETLGRAERHGVAGRSWRWAIPDALSRSLHGQRFVASDASGVRQFVDVGGHGDIGVVRMVVEDVVLHLVVVREP
jgi:hypothetical protein